MKILLDIFLQTSCKIIVWRVTKEGELVFCNKYLDWDCVNKWGSVDLENISSICNTKLTEFTLLSIAGVERLWKTSFLVKST